MRKIISGPEHAPLEVQEGLSTHRKLQAFMQEIEEFGEQIQLCNFSETSDSNSIIFHFDSYFVHVKNSILDRFIEKFRPYITNKVILYDNLINLCIMVKNAGDGFRDILEKNLPYIDRYTILDTGSTDNTVSIAQEVLKDKRGNIYQEPFIDFPTSRNRLLELAGTDCFFNIMLDDTYVIHGKLREFLDFVRGDDVADSFAIVIEDIDTMYTSTRILKSSKALQYVNRIHEIVNAKCAVLVPYEVAHIQDIDSDYMRQRTKKRKLQDLAILYEMLEENPSDSRTYYYIADTYLGLKEWNKALEWFEKRAQLNGYEAEIQDSLYYIAVLKDIYLGCTWSDCFDAYLKCYESNPSRAESLYFIACHYMKKNMTNTARMFLKNAYMLGMPSIQMSVRKNIYKFHIPKDLAALCYTTGEYKLGEEASYKALQYQDDTLVRNWYNIYTLLNQSNFTQKKERYCTKNVISFVAPGGWESWDGETFYTCGLGGSESFVVQYAEYLSKLLEYKVLVFCNCEKTKNFNNVTYVPLCDYPSFVSKYEVDLSLVNRYPEYLHLNVLQGVKTYFVLHDVSRPLDILPTHTNLCGVLCISEWQKKNFLQRYPDFVKRTSVISYGINTDRYFSLEEKKKYMFIYPNFANRGLLQLLKLWPRILEKYPSATLHTFCNTQNTWCQKYWASDMLEIERMFKEYKDTVINHGWVNKSTLRYYWSVANIWFYPCTFEETCCLTALEAAASRTLAVTNQLAALCESVGDRGVTIEGDASSEEWQESILSKMFTVIDSNNETEYTDRNYEWVQNKNFNIVVSEFNERFLKKYMQNTT